MSRNPKRLKQIPCDIVSYVSIEGEAIRDANDKMMIVSYAQGKLKNIDWYLQLLARNSEDYIVPHSREYLEGLKRDLQKAIQKIMNRPIPQRQSAVSVNYPRGYEG